MLKAVLLTIFSLVSLDLYSAACCTSAGAFGIGRLTIWEKFALGLNQSFAFESGYFDSQHHIYAAEDFRLLLKTNIWGMVGLKERFLLFLQQPLISYTAPWQSALGDLNVGLRYQALSLGEYQYIPALAFYFSAYLPSGISAIDNEDYLATGKGVYSLTLGISLEENFQNWFVQLNSSVNIPFARYSKVFFAKYAYGITTETGLAVGTELINDLIISMLGSFAYESTRFLEEREIKNSNNYITNISLALSYKFNPYFTVQTALGSDINIPFFGRNKIAQATFSTGIRYAYF